MFIRTKHKILIAMTLAFFWGCQMADSKSTKPDPDLEDVLALLESLEITMTRAELENTTNLDLFGSNLSDKDMALIRQLHWLESLNLGQTRVTARGFKKLKGALPNLQSLNLSGLAFHDSCETTLQTMPKLRELNLSYTVGMANELSSLNLPEIRVLVLSYSDLESLANLKNPAPITHLYLNGIADLEIDWNTFAKFPHLKQLEINSSNLRISDPSWSHHLAGLRRLSLQNTHFMKLEVDLKGLIHLVELDIAGSTVPNSLWLQQLRQLPQLLSLDISDLKILAKNSQKSYKGANAPVCHLQSLRANDVDSDDADFTFLRHCKNLEHLELSSSRITGKLFYKAAFPRLQSLDLSHSFFDGRYLAEIKKIHSLRKLNLENSKINPGQMQHILGLSKLEVLILNQTNPKDLFPAIFNRLPRLKKLEVIQTSLNPKMMELWQKKYPQIEIEFGH